MMSKHTILKLALAILVLLNIGLMSHIYLQNSKHRGEHPPHGKQGLLHEFGFDDSQTSAFEVSKEKHRASVASLRAQLEEVSLAYYLLPDQSPGKATKFAMADSISDEIYLLNNQHFSEVRALCTEEQLPKMNKFIRDLLRPRPKRGPR